MSHTTTPVDQYEYCYDGLRFPMSILIMAGGSRSVCFPAKVGSRAELLVLARVLPDSVFFHVEKQLPLDSIALVTKGAVALLKPVADISQLERRYGDGT